MERISPFFLRRTSCPLCDSRSLRVLFRLSYLETRLAGYLHSYYHGKIPGSHLAGASYCLVQCSECSFVFQQDVPDANLAAIIYDPPPPCPDPHAIFLAYEQERSLGHFLSLVPGLVDIIRHLGSRPRHLAMLDFGMGWGNWCQLARGFGCTVFGCEASPIRLAYARQSSVPCIAYEEISSMRFDFVNTEQVFEHLNDPLGTLRTLRASLKAGGVLKMSVPDSWRTAREIKAGNWVEARSPRVFFGTAHPLEHVNSFTYDTIISMARRAGLTPTTVKRVCYFSLRERLADLLRRVYHPLTGRKSTCLCFRNA